MTLTYNYVLSAIPGPFIATQLQGIAEDVLNRWGPESTAVCRVSLGDGGYVWCRIVKVWNPPSMRGEEGATVETVSGREVFVRWTDGGWAYYEDTTIRATAIEHAAIVENGEISLYIGKPYSKTQLPITIPKWTRDGWDAEFRLGQQELREELDNE